MKITIEFDPADVAGLITSLAGLFGPMSPATLPATPQWAPTSPFWAEPIPPPADPPACVEPDPLATKLSIDLGRRPTVGELAHARRQASSAPDAVAAAPAPTFERTGFTFTPAAPGGHPPMGAEPPTTPPTEPPAILPPVADLRAGTGVTLAKLNEAGNLELVEESSRVTPIRLGPATLAALATGKAPVDPAPAPTVAPSTPAPATEPKRVKPGKPATPGALGARQPSVNRVAVQLATNRQASGAELSWDLFDALVRKEVDRLAPVPGQMPSHAIWNTQRDPQLPTLTTIQTRYGVPSVEALAQLLGFTPPPRGPRPATNGDEGTKETEAVSA